MAHRDGGQENQMGEGDEFRAKRVQEIRGQASREAESEEPPPDGLGIFASLLIIAAVVAVIAGFAGADGGPALVAGGVVLFALALGLVYLLGIRASLRRLEALLARALLRDDEPPTSMPGKP